MAKKTTTTPPTKKTTTTASKKAAPPPKKPTPSATKKPTPTASKKAAPAKKPAPAKKRAPVKKATSGGGMGVFAVIVVIAACGVIGAAFFFTFFFVSFAGFGASVTGIEAALGDGSSDSGTEDANPALLLALALPVVLLVMLCVPPLRKKQGFFRLPVIGCMAIIVAIVALIVLYFAYSSTIGTWRRVFEGFDTYLAEMGETDFVTIGTGIGFKVAVIAHIVLFCIPFLDKCFRRKK